MKTNKNILILTILLLIMGCASTPSLNLRNSEDGLKIFRNSDSSKSVIEQMKVAGDLENSATNYTEQIAVDDALSLVRTDAVKMGGKVLIINNVSSKYNPLTAKYFVVIRATVYLEGK